MRYHCGICIICQQIMNILSKMHISKCVNALWFGLKETARWDKIGYESGLSRAQTLSQTIQKCVPLGRRIIWEARGGLKKRTQRRTWLSALISSSSLYSQAGNTSVWKNLMRIKMIKVHKSDTFQGISMNISRWFVLDRVQFSCRTQQDHAQSPVSGCMSVYSAGRGTNNRRCCCTVPLHHCGHSGGLPRTRFPHLGSVFRFPVQGVRGSHWSSALT